MVVFYVLEKNSCRNAVIETTPYIVNTGEYTLQNAIISSNGLSNLVIESRGYYGASNSTLYCYSGSTCDIKCSGDESCYGMNVYCEDGATCKTSCHSYSTCPMMNDVDTIDDSLLTAVKETNNINAYNELKEEEKNMNVLAVKQSMINNGDNIVMFVVNGCILLLAMIGLYTLTKFLFSKCQNNKDVSWVGNRYEYQSI